MPVARLPKLSDRTSGVLLHPTSLPGGWESGDLGAEARAFVDFLADAGQSWWQMLPVGPTGYANSPYSAQSAFAGNPLLIDSERLVADGYLSREGSAARPIRTAEKRIPRAPDGWRGRGRGFQAFVKAARPWLEDFALYRALKRAHGEVQWTLWPAPLRDRDPARAGAMRGASYADEIALRRASCSGASRAVARAARLRARARRRPSSATCRSSSPTTAPTSGSTASSSRSTQDGRADAASPACRPTTSARPGSAGATRSTAGSAARRRATPGGSSASRHARRVRRRPPRSLHRLRALLGDPGGTSRPR